jgi:hypothetical protein
MTTLIQLSVQAVPACAHPVVLDALSVGRLRFGCRGTSVSGRALGGAQSFDLAEAPGSGHPRGSAGRLVGR